MIRKVAAPTITPLKFMSSLHFKTTKVRKYYGFSGLIPTIHDDPQSVYLHFGIATMVDGQ